MNETASIMKKEIRLIAGYRALIISRYFLTLLLSIISLYLNYKHYAVSSLYILLFLNILPSILVYALNDYSKKNDKRLIKVILEDPEFKLKQLRSKYKYSKVSYIANSVSFLLALFLICLWQVNYSKTMADFSVLANLPFILLASGLIVRILGFIFYKLKFPYILRHNKL